ncbi:MAG: competence/damage-inducible protein A [Deltaproteobacteria bacterium]|nr:competence/damage-inducible protein A [Deltaproteobacteria bacterium]
MTRKTVRLVIIGNEVLSGKIADANTPWLLGRLRQIGAVCTGVQIVQDTMSGVAEAVRTDAEAADWVITTGGVGPTHDDITMAAVARGFGVDVVEHPDLIALLASHIGEDLTEHQRRLARVPDGAVLREGGAFPTIQFRNVLILPGVPALVRSKFEQFESTIAGERLPCSAVRTTLRETELVPYLEDTLAEVPAADIGSYPRRGQDGWRVLLTLEAPDQTNLDRALAALLTRLPADAVHDVLHDFRPEDEGGLGE